MSHAVPAPHEYRPITALRLAAMFAGTLMCLCVGSLAAEQIVWLVGSGPDRENTQVQIERNLLWARETLAGLPGERRFKTFFTDGTDPAPDLTQWQRVDDSPAQLQPLARVYDTYYLNGETLRDHQVSRLNGPATRDVIEKALATDLTAMQPGDEGLLVYVGHGSRRTGESRLDLWDRTSLTATDLAGLLDRQPDATRLRLVFTQCHAGGFHAALRVAQLRHDDVRERCAFYAVAAEALAEGCTASLEVGDYRGYSTYFFAALAGQARTGGALAQDPDRNGDGRTDLYEAHLHSLRAARSMDLPRSSSEQFLLDWEPWYLPLIRVPVAPDNPYRQIAWGLAEDLGLVPDRGRLKPALAEHRQRVQAQIRRLIYRQEQHRSRAESARQQLLNDLQWRWPGARYPYTQAFRAFLLEDADTTQAFIEQHPLYRDLVADQDGYWALASAILELQRRAAQLDRIAHLLHLARLQTAFTSRAGTAQQARYTALSRCEQRPL